MNQTNSIVQTLASTASIGLVETLNKECFCISLDIAALRKALESEIGSYELFELVQERCPYLFAARPVFVSSAHMKRMTELVQAIEFVVALPAYREKVLSQSPAIARHSPGGAKGVFFGYDFHVAESSFGLLEINTNAGGAMLNAVLARAQRGCCPGLNAFMPQSMIADEFEARIVAMFQNEWEISNRNHSLQTIAIVDENPSEQYLYPEFLLFKQLFERNGWKVVIADPTELQFRDDKLWHGDTAVDLVYNRLTDFSLETAASSALREAYLQNAIVLTPHPQAHALYADKRNLVLLTDATQLEALGVPADTRAVLLAGIPHTEVVDPAQAERLWQNRRQLFFKPTAGFGSRAAYRGDKITQRVWQEILAGNYVAQALVAPGGRAIHEDKTTQVLKFDLRDYVYNGELQWVAARLYQGQTTNFRTPGGGFAPVYEEPILGQCCQ